MTDLFTHSSGLACFLQAPTFDYTHAYKPDDIINFVKAEPLVFEPGTKSHLNATDYYLLGMIIEKASGQRYEDFVRVNQFERIGLKNTCFISTQDRIKNEVNENQANFRQSQFLHNSVFVNPTELAVGYNEAEQGLESVPLSSYGATFADMGVLSSAEDISLWDICLAGDILIKDPTHRAFVYSPVKLRNGSVVPANAHWEFNGHKGYMQIRGNLPGYSSILCRYTAPTELLCVTILVNKGDVENLAVLARQIDGAYDGTLATPDAASPNTTLQSPYSVSDTAKRAKQFIEEAGGSIFSHINHSEAAAKVNLKLKPTEVVLFGNPSVGTALMQQQGAIAMELPLRAAIWEDEAGMVWVTVTDLIVLALRYQLDASLQTRIKKMTINLFKLLNNVIGQNNV